jgi:hypothetical protein
VRYPPLSALGLYRIVFGTTWLVCLLSAQMASALAPPPPTPTPTWFPRCDFTPVPNAGPPGTLVGFGGTCYPIHSGQPGAILFDDTVVAHVSGETAGDYGGGFTYRPTRRWESSTSPRTTHRIRDRLAEVSFVAATANDNAR